MLAALKVYKCLLFTYLHLLRTELNFKVSTKQPPYETYTAEFDFDEVLVIMSFPEKDVSFVLDKDEEVQLYLHAIMSAQTAGAPTTSSLTTLMDTLMDKAPERRPPTAFYDAE